MDTLFDLLKEVAPALVTGVISYLLAKYKYHKDVPLDKMEKAYDEVYFPLYQAVRDECSAPELLEKTKIYYDEFYKYFDRSTLVAYELLKDNLEDKEAFANYKSNIIETNCRLRSRLGYLEPSFWSMYTYAPAKDKKMIRFVFEFSILYIFIMLATLMEGEKETAFVFAVVIIAVVVLVVELVGIGIAALRRKIKK